MSKYQVLARSKGRGELRKFVADVVKLSIAAKWEWGGVMFPSAFNNDNMFMFLSNSGKILVSTRMEVDGVNQNVLLSSNDEGRTFVRDHAPLPWANIGYASPENIMFFENGDMLAHGRYRFFVSSDGGITWTQRVNLYDIFGYDYNASECVHLGSGEILCHACKGTVKSFDYGKTWKYYGPIDQNHNLPMIQNMILLDNGVVVGFNRSANYAYSPHTYHTYKSLDRGETWERTYYPYYTAPNDYSPQQMFYLGGGVLLLSSRKSGTTKLSLSEDHGDSFYPIPVFQKIVPEATRDVRVDVHDAIQLAPGVLAVLCWAYVNGPYDEDWAEHRFFFYMTTNFGKTWFEVPGTEIIVRRHKASIPNGTHKLIQLPSDPGSVLVVGHNLERPYPDWYMQAMVFSELM